MPLTEKQRIALSKLPLDDQLEIVDNIFELIGMLSVKEYAEVTGLGTREIYRLIKADKVKYRQYSGMYFISLVPPDKK